VGKILGIDWGEKLTGIAISDELKLLAKPFKTIESKSLEDILNILKEEGVEKIIIGRPRNMDGSLGPQSKKVSKFVSELRKITKVAVTYEDETNTTNIVKNMLVKEGINPQKNKELINKKAAQLILQGYLDEINK
jgi:putative Holliday junction resolvase